MTKVQAHAYLGTLAVAALFGINVSGLMAEESNTRTVHWLLAHQPADVYDHAIDVFATELEQESGGSLKLEAVAPEDLNIENPVSHERILQLLDEGTVELSSTYGVANGTMDQEFWSWELPFLFSNYDEVETAFESAAGERALTHLSDNSPVHALAFTLSGGFRVIASKEKISSVEDLKGLRIATAGGPVAEATLASAGAIPVPIALGGNTEDMQDIDAVETTYARLSSLVGDNSAFTAYIAETNHSLFLTTLVASDAFYDSLSPEEQQALVRAARKAAATERQSAIALNAATKASLEANDTVITTFSNEDREAFKEATKTVYKPFTSAFSN